MKFTQLLWVAAVLCCIGVSRAESPERTTAWAEQVQTLAAALRGELPRTAWTEMLTPSAWMQPFDRDAAESAKSLPERVSGLHVISARGYTLDAYLSAATDIQADLRNSACPEPLTRHLLIADESKLRSADAAFARWFGVALDAMPDDLVAYVLLMDDGLPDVAAGRAARPATFYFVLLKASIDEHSAIRVERAAYGNLEQAAK